MSTTQRERQTAILDAGYSAVRLMARSMIENGASSADILFHANQLWHEFKAVAMGMPGVIATGMYVDQYNRELTDQIISHDIKYVRADAPRPRTQ